MFNKGLGCVKGALTEMASGGNSTLESSSESLMRFLNAFPSKSKSLHDFMLNAVSSNEPLKLLCEQL